MSTAVLIVLIICGTLLISLIAILIYARKVNKEAQKTFESFKDDFPKF